jgi:ferredoxin
VTLEVARKIGQLTVRIDRTLCVGFGDCVTEAPDAFQLDDDEIAVFGERPDGVRREKLLKACEACPVDALSVSNESGEQLVP